jgi:hypothetical protein
MNREIKLYDVLSEEEFLMLLSDSKTEALLKFQELKIVEIKEEDIYGDFLFINNYGFKKTYGSFQCLITPTEKHTKQIICIPKSSNDRSKNFYTRWKSRRGGKDGFNPVTGTGSPNGKKTL